MRRRPKRAPAEVAAEMDEDAENDATLDACGGETHWHVETRCVACVWRVIGDQLEISAPVGPILDLS